MPNGNIFQTIEDIRTIRSHQHREITLESVDGLPRVCERIYEQQVSPEGVVSILEGERYLCQRCGTVWVALGQEGFCWKNLILCRKCLRSSKLGWLLKPLWSLFVRIEE